MPVPADVLSAAARRGARSSGPALLRPDAPTCPQRLFCHTYGRGRGQAQMIPGWPYSVVAALEPGRTSWTAVLDAVRLAPGQDATAVTAEQVREVIGPLRAAAQHRDGDPDVLVVLDARYDVHPLAFLLADLPVQLLWRLRAYLLLCRPAPPRRPRRGARPPRHSTALALSHPEYSPPPQISTTTYTSRYCRAHAQSFDPLHPPL